MQYLRRICDIAINAVDLSGIRSEYRGRILRVRISSRDRLRWVHMLILTEKNRFIIYSVAKRTHVHTPIHVQEVWCEYLIFFLEINSRRTNISPSVILRVAVKRHREWDLNKNAIFCAAWLFRFYSFHEYTPCGMIYLKMSVQWLNKGSLLKR